MSCAARAALGALALAALPGCGSYIPDYVPPPDGRARPVYRDGAVAMEIGGPIPECLSGEPGSVGAPPPARDAAQAPPVRVSGAFWVPVYFGPQIVVERRGVAPPPPHLHRAEPDVVRHAASPSKGITGGNAKSGGAASGGNAGSGGRDAGSAAASTLLAAFAVVALVALPPIAVGLSVGRPEREKDTARALDHVNAYNDSARTPGSPCAVGVQGGQAR
ncbi:uncharacterized protein SOCE836_044530 [Sorangium cellulosum]|uniref:Secreted protein n=1 Tax=Sorangium cellulosum TaxID=56 RepID=A0A4P2QQN9_SORCE|nr:uncharacterized protein SOCE836_044530 [Sorangium cellulosum]WCQ91690.1 hypothetical protein NQZ70_04413 [Sorangium sp. Soce836]